MEGDLLGLGEEVRRVPVERQRSDDLHRRQLLRHQLGRVEEVDPLEHLVRGVREGLDAEVPRGEGARLDGVVEVAAVEVRVDPAGQLGLLPREGVHAEPRLPVELDEGRPTVRVDEPEGVDAEPLHHPIAARDAAIRHVPDGVVLRLGVQRHEVPEGVVGALRLWDLPVRVRLGGVDDVRELDAVLDEEDRDVVADEVPVALAGVELRREAAGVAHRVGRPAGPEHGREAHERAGLLTLAEDGGTADPGGRAVRGRRRRGRRHRVRGRLAPGCARGRSA